MTRDRYAVSYAQTPIKPLIQRGLTVLLVITGITLLVLARAQNPLVATARARMLDTLSPVIGWLAEPARSLRSVIDDKNAFLNAVEENTRLRHENETLRHWQAAAEALKAENDALHTLANYTPVTHASYVTARIIGQSPSGYGATLTLNAGAAEGVAPLQPVIDADGLIGRVTDVGDHTARVLLLTDSSSRIPVLSATARVRAILSGTGARDALLRLSFVDGDSAHIALGETIVTTEEGGLIPGGLPIGTVFRRDGDTLLVKPLRPLAQSEYVRVVVVK